MQKELDLFKSLFQPSPNIAVLHINHKVDFIKTVIEEVVEQNEGKLDFKNFETQDDAKLRASAREYEYIVLSDILWQCPNKAKLLKLFYKALENSANIIVLEHKRHQNLEEIKTLLDQTSFVAINHIDLFEEYELITAKKLHMWGSGL